MYIRIYDASVRITDDAAKNERNIRERGLSFEKAAEFDFDTAHFQEDKRRDYGKNRMQATGFLGARLHMLVFVESTDGIRGISFRKANKREVQRYEEEAQPGND